jgi:hypothetical protein
MSEVTHHPSGVQVEIVGIEECNRERSCEQHTCCGKVIALDTVLRLRKVQILNGTLQHAVVEAVRTLLKKNTKSILRADTVSPQ